MQQPQNNNSILKLHETEYNAKKRDACLLAASTWGVDEFVGPITSVGLELDYDNIIPELYEALTGGTITSSMRNEIINSIPTVYGHVLTLSSLNDIANNEVANQLALYKAIYGAIWHTFGAKRIPDYLITDNLPLKEVVRNTKLAKYTTNQNETPYIVCQNSGSIQELVPQAQVVTGNKDYLAVRVANLLSKFLYLDEIIPAATKYADYDFLCGGLSEKHKEALKNKGLTEYHRPYVKELTKYAFNTQALRSLSGVTNKPKKYVNRFVVSKE